MRSAADLSFESHRPSPERLWIRHRPRHWPAPEKLWTDWARLSLGSPGRAAAALPPRELERPPSDVVYLPPVAGELAADRERLAESWREVGVPLLVQRLPGEEGKAESSVWDLLPALLDDDLAGLSRLPAGAAAAWPLVAGLTDDEELVREGLDRLADGGAAIVQPLVPELSAGVRRRLARQGDESTFDRLFHGPPPDARRFASEAAARGLAPFLPRPLPPGPPRLAVRRRCAGELRLAAELCFRLGRPELEEQRLLRAARWIDREDYDLEALAAEDNLSLVDWFDAPSRRLIREVLESGASSLVTELTAEYVRG